MLLGAFAADGVFAGSLLPPDLTLVLPLRSLRSPRPHSLTPPPPPLLFSTGDRLQEHVALADGIC